MSVECGRLTVLTGAAGPLPATPWWKGMGMDLMPKDLVQRWEAVYGEYLSARADRAKTARLSADVAAAWREMAASPGLPWWTVAALRTAAEAFERQAGAWSGAPHTSTGRPTDRGPVGNSFRTPPSDDVDC